MQWNHLENPEEIDVYMRKSYQMPVLSFKHSIRCSISATALNRLERNWVVEADITPVYIDLINFRMVSNHLADRLGVHHESPQAILIENGRVVGSWSHLAISWSSIAAVAIKS